MTTQLLKRQRAVVAEFLHVDSVAAMRMRRSRQRAVVAEFPHVDSAAAMRMSRWQGQVAR